MKSLGRFWHKQKYDEEFEKKIANESELIAYKAYKDAILGQVNIVQNSINKQFFIIRERAFEALSPAKSYVETTKVFEQLDNPYLLRPLDHSIKLERSFCVKRYIVKQKFSFPRNDLRREIDHRIEKGLTFSVSEMAHLLYQVIEVNAYLQWKEIVHGNLRPEAFGVQVEPEILLQLKLSPEEKGRSSSFREEIMREYLSKKSIYVSPAVFRCLVKNKEFSGDLCAEDVFSAGLVILEAGNVTPLAQIYRADGELDEDTLRRFVQDFKGRYMSESTLLVSVLENMLQRSDNRPTFQDLKDNMPLYEEVKNFLKENHAK